VLRNVDDVRFLVLRRIRYRRSIYVYSRICPQLFDAKFFSGINFRSCVFRCYVYRRFSRYTLESLVSRISSASFSFALADQPPIPFFLFTTTPLHLCYVLFYSFFLQSEHSSYVERRGTTPFYTVCCTTRMKRTPADSCRKGIESAGRKRLGRCDIESTWSCERRRASSSRISKQTARAW